MSELTSASTNSIQNYKIYPGDYPIVVIENAGYTRRAELDLNIIVEKHDLKKQLDLIIWIEHILTHTGMFDVLITKQESWHMLSVYSFPTEGLRANGEYIIPEKVVKALINRCESGSQRSTSNYVPMIK